MILFCFLNIGQETLFVWVEAITKIIELQELENAPKEDEAFLKSLHIFMETSLNAYLDKYENYQFIQTSYEK